MIHLTFEVIREYGANCGICGQSGMVRDLKLAGRSYLLTACQKCAPDPDPEPYREDILHPDEPPDDTTPLAA